jgi:hypothetical protein
MYPNGWNYAIPAPRAFVPSSRSRPVFFLNNLFQAKVLSVLFLLFGLMVCWIQSSLKMDGVYHLSLSPNRKSHIIKTKENMMLPSLPLSLSAGGPCEQALKYEVGSSRLGEPSFPDCANNDEGGSTRDPR